LRGIQISDICCLSCAAERSTCSWTDAGTCDGISSLSSFDSAVHSQAQCEVQCLHAQANATHSGCCYYDASERRCLHQSGATRHSSEIGSMIKRGKCTSVRAEKGTAPPPTTMVMTTTSSLRGSADGSGTEQNSQNLNPLIVVSVVSVLCGLVIVVLSLWTMFACKCLSKRSLQLANSASSDSNSPSSRRTSSGSNIATVPSSTDGVTYPEGQLQGQTEEEPVSRPFESLCRTKDPRFEQELKASLQLANSASSDSNSPSSRRTSSDSNVSTVPSSTDGVTYSEGQLQGQTEEEPVSRPFEPPCRTKDPRFEQKLKAGHIEQINSTITWALSRIDSHYEQVGIASAPHKTISKLLDDVKSEFPGFFMNPDADFGLLGVGALNSAGWVRAWHLTAELAGKKGGTAFFFKHHDGLFYGSQQHSELEIARRIEGLHIVEVLYTDDGAEEGRRTLR